MKTKLIVLATVVFLLTGCSSWLSKNPETGESYIKPEVIETIDEAASTVATVGEISSAASVWYPPLAAIGGLLAGLGGAWAKIRPKLIEAQDEAELGLIAGEATAETIEKFKEQYPDEWKKLEELFSKYHGPTVEAFYRELRGLPPKI